jgi:hypothetical protein
MDMRGTQWTDEELAVLTANPKPPMTFNTIAEPPFVMPIVDRDLLNPLAQPTAYEKERIRVFALHQYIYWCKKLAVARFEGHGQYAESAGRVAARYKEKYQFTQEEIDGYRREEN